MERGSITAMMTSSCFAQIAAINPADVEGYKRFLAYSAGVYEEGYLKLGTKAFESIADMVKAAPALAKYQAWRSVYSIVSKFVADEHLRQALSFHTLLVGGNPMTCSAIYALIHKLERDGGVWFAKGGTNKLVDGMVAPVHAAWRRASPRRSGRRDRG
jgi:phytoene desaturase